MRENEEAVYKWLRNAAKRRHIDARIHTELVKQDRNWLYIPVYVEGSDAAEKALILQKLEDAWRNRKPEPYWQLLLIPTAH